MFDNVVCDVLMSDLMIVLLKKFDGLIDVECYV